MSNIPFTREENKGYWLAFFERLEDQILGEDSIIWRMWEDGELGYFENTEWEFSELVDAIYRGETYLGSEDISNEHVQFALELCRLIRYLKEDSNQTFKFDDEAREGLLRVYVADMKANLEREYDMAQRWFESSQNYNEGIDFTIWKEREYYPWYLLTALVYDSNFRATVEQYHDTDNSQIFAFVANYLVYEESFTKRQRVIDGLNLVIQGKTTYFEMEDVKFDKITELAQFETTS